MAPTNTRKHYCGDTLNEADDNTLQLRGVQNGIEVLIPITGKTLFCPTCKVAHLETESFKPLTPEDIKPPAANLNPDQLALKEMNEQFAAMQVRMAELIAKTQGK
jgi:hypothetical protein